MNKRKHPLTRSLIALFMTLAVIMTAACGQTANTEKEGADSRPTAEASATKEPASYPFTIKDDTGAELTFEHAPATIVTLAPSETETVFAIGGGERVVGVDENSNYPSEAQSIAKIGDVTTNVEAVAALDPELVIASSSMNADAITKLRELDIPVYATDPTTYDAVISKVETLGEILDMHKEAEAVAKRMREVKEEVAEAVKAAEKKKVYLEFSPGWTVGSGTFLDELITLAGGVNISAAKPGWFEVSAEEVVTQNPALIIYPDFGEEPSPIVQGIESRPGWRAIDAVKNKQMVKVSNDPLVRPGPRLADGLLELAAAIHPDLVD